MSVRTKTLTVIGVINLAILMAVLVIAPHVLVDRAMEAAVLARANRVSVAIVLQGGISDIHREAAALQSAIGSGTDPKPAAARLLSATTVIRNQLAFLPERPDFDSSSLYSFIRNRDAQIAGLLAAPIDAAAAAHLAAVARDLDERGLREISIQLDRANAGIFKDTTAAFARLRWRLGTALAAMVGALLLSLAASTFVYRQLLRPLAALNESLNAVLTGRLPAAEVMIETHDEFGDVVRAMRRIQAQAEHIRRIAYLDPGSKLPNRNSLEGELREVRRLRPIDGTHGLLLIGIDTYNAIRSGFGTRLAEAVMAAASQRLHDLDVLPTQIFRFEADIVAILTDRGSSDAVTRVDVKRIAAEVMQRLSQPLEVDDHRFLLSASAGGAIYPDDAHEPDEYVNVCAEALRLARHEGPGHLRFGERGHTHRLRRQLALTEQLRSGLRQGQFLPFFQPIVDTAQGKVIGAEALMRWRQPDGRIILPSEFILVAENSDLIVDLTRAVLLHACNTFGAWTERGHELHLSFNLSAKLLSTDVLEVIREALSKSRLDPTRLCAEITETALMGNLEDVSFVLKEMRRLGIGVTLDDFGTGYSSLTHLYQFDVSGLKIDPALTRAAAQSPRAQEIIRSMAALANRLDIRLMIEGVESEEDVLLMRKLGCRLMQGFYFSRALPEEQFLEWSRNYEAGARAA